MNVYGSGNYTQHGLAHDQDQLRHAQQMTELYKNLAAWQAVFRGRLEQWGRAGPSPALRASIAEAAKECGDVVDAIMNATPPMLSGPAPNRY